MKINELLEELKPHIVRKEYKHKIYNIEFDTYIVIGSNPPYPVWGAISRNNVIEVNIDGISYVATKNVSIDTKNVYDLVYMIPTDEEIERGKVQRLLDELEGLSGSEY